jgi:penicillin-binding protein 1C
MMASCPNTLVADIPTQIAGYTPKFQPDIWRSSSPSGISAIVEYSFCIDVTGFWVNKFYEELQRFKLRIFQNPDHYGLSLYFGWCRK